MSHSQYVASLGGVFAILVLVHFIVDWLLQSHSEAMAKSKNSLIRAKHCFIYTINFVPVMYFLDLSALQIVVSILLLFISHFFEDTYYPVMLWAKYVRKPPEFATGESDETAFIKWASTPLGKILAIVADQLVHLVFLLPIAHFAVT